MVVDGTEGAVMGNFVNKVAVVGGGTVGVGIALDFVLGGKEVVVCNRTVESGRRALDRMRRCGLQLVEFGLIDAVDVAVAMRRVSTTAEIAEAVATADYVVEAVPEDLRLKRRVLAEIGRHAGPDVVIASTTTGIQVADLAVDCVNPKRVLTARYTLPAHLIPVVDVVAGAATSPATVEVALRV